MGDHVFICYAREDQEFATRLAMRLKDRGVPVWLDQWDIPPGANWNKGIDEAISGCATFLVVLSQAAVDSEEVQGEWLTALDERKPVVPVLSQACRIPRRLRVFQYVDFTARSLDEKAGFEQVVRVLGTAQAPAVAEAPSPRMTRLSWASTLGMAGTPVEKPAWLGN
jgi:hypothetical protein